MSIVLSLSLSLSRQQAELALLFGDPFTYFATSLDPSAGKCAPKDKHENAFSFVVFDFSGLPPCSRQSFSPSNKRRRREIDII